MKIGILTFQADVNYGTVLQAFAMQTHLESLGHNAIIIDKIEDANNVRLLGPLVNRSLKFWLKLCFRSLIGCEDVYAVLRSVKTMLFIRKYYKRTPYSFYKWNDAPKNLDFDLITIGSDQVWNHTIVDPPDYLLKDVDSSIPGIAYSASIGEKQFANEWLDEYVSGFRRLKAIGVREQEAKTLIERLGFAAEHVVDPTLLVDPEVCWGRFAVKRQPSRKRLFCYFLDEDFRSMLPVMTEFAAKKDAIVDFFVGNVPLTKLPHRVGEIKQYWTQRSMWNNRYVHTHFAGAPDDFVKAISQATWVVTNSFHGLMMATVFRKDVRLVRSSLAWRAQMSARVEEFAKSALSESIICNSLTEAFLSMNRHISYNEGWIEMRRKQSAEWLTEAIRNAVSSKGRK